MSETAVRKGIQHGRLVKSVDRSSGRPKIVDVALARQEWQQNASGPPKSGQSSSGAAKKRSRRASPGLTLAAAQRQVALARANGLELLNAERRKRLIPAEQAVRQAFEAARVIRDAMLNIPARVSAELAAETDEKRVHARLEHEIRLALASIADHLAVAG